MSILGIEVQITLLKLAKELHLKYITPLQADKQHFLKYTFIGAFGVSLHFLIYFLFFYLGMPYLYANCLGYVAGTFVTYSLNYFYNFQSESHFFQRFLLFICVAIIGMMVSSILLFTAVGLIGLNHYFGLFVSLPCVLILQFFLNKKFTFK